MPTLALDIETYSDVSLADAGVYRYAESEEFEILLFAYSFDEGEVKVIDLASGERIPKEIVRALTDPAVVKRAYNAQFERVCLSRLLGFTLDPSQWQCTMAYAAMLGLPGSLEQVAGLLNLTERKMTEGKALIRYFSVPCRPTRANGGRTRNLPEHDPDRWALFKSYNAQDVRTETAVYDYCLRRYPFPERERAVYALDQRINDYGVGLDLELVNSIVTYDALYQGRLLEDARQLTGLENPNSVSQLRRWLLDRGVRTESLDRKAVAKILDSNPDPAVSALLRLRGELAKTSVKKYRAMLEGANADGRLRGVLKYYGAGRTGRWAGRLVQVQNLPRNSLKELDGVRTMVKRGEFSDLALLYESLSDLFSQLVRTAFVAPEGQTYLIADYSAIEARVLAWLAGETWKTDLFAAGGKLYEHTAGRMFNVPPDSIAHDSPLRAKGKVAELACGYGGSVGALTAMGALDMGLEAAELPGLVEAWRRANPAIVRLWNDVDLRAKHVVEERSKAELHHGVFFSADGEFLRIALPSGRSLSYYRPHIAHGRLYYLGTDQTRRTVTELDTFGGKLIENIVQALARDCLAEAMLRLGRAGFRLVFHVHDEVIAEGRPERLDEMKAIMGAPLPWAPGLLLRAEGYCSPYYRKD